ncbi:hypothetical protein ABZP36_033726 [Zizania latifolia]
MAILLLLLLSLALSAPAAAGDGLAPAVAARPGCPTRCGAVDVPFPFGVGEQCALAKAHTRYPFKLDCLSVAGVSKPFYKGIEVTNISLSDGKAWMKMNMSKNCYNQSTGAMEGNRAHVDFTGTPFWISNVDNKIVVIGCQTFAYLQINNVLTGCVSTCNKDSIPVNVKCSGAGCCQVDFPNGTWYYSTYFSESYNTSQIWRSSPCSYITVIETTAFNFYTTYLNSTVFYDTYKGLAPVSLDWIITMDSCDEAKNTTSYACVSDRSTCVNDPKGGYRCSCSHGFQGNPYMKNGCTAL